MSEKPTSLECKGISFQISILHIDLSSVTCCASQIHWPHLEGNSGLVIQKNQILFLWVCVQQELHALYQFSHAKCYFVLLCSLSASFACIRGTDLFWYLKCFNVHEHLQCKWLYYWFSSTYTQLSLCFSASLDYFYWVVGVLTSFFPFP